MPLSSPAERRDALARYDFRGVHPRLRFGTASDRYAGWIGQVYPQAWAETIQTRKKKVGGQSYDERMLPVASAAEYFEHFGVLELDFTFYRPLLEPDAKPSSNLHTLRQYADAAPAEARFLLKAPQAFSARVLRRGRGFEPNPTYLDADGMRRLFLDPARELLGERLLGGIFQQEYSRVRESPEPEAFVAELDGFFRALPRDVPLHLEVRSEHLLTDAYFDWLAAEGLGFCFSHWTWLPPLKRQWEMTGRRLLPSSGEAVVRLLAPRDLSHEESYTLAYPFADAVPALSETPEALAMVDEATALAYHAVAEGVSLTVVAGNRAWGNSPKLAQAVAGRFLDFAAARGA